MKSDQMRQLQECPAEELNQKIAEFQEKLFNLKLKHRSGGLKNPLEIRDLKRDIARVLTIINSKKKKS